MIVEIEMKHNPKTRRVETIIDEKMEWYHPAGVSDPYRLLCYYHNIPIGIKPKTQRVEMIIENDMTYNPKTQRVDKIIAIVRIKRIQTRRVVMIIENDMSYKPKTRRVDKIVGKNMHMQILHLTDDVIIHRMITKNTTPFGFCKNVSSACYNPAIPAGIITQTRRVAMIIENDMTYKPKTRRVGKIIEMISLCIFQTQRVDKIIDEKSEWRNYHPTGVSILHHLSCYNHNIPLGLKTKPTNGRINLIAI